MAFRAFSGSGRLRLPILAPLAAAFVAALQSSAPQARETDLSILDAQQRRETRQVELSSAGDVAQRLTLLNLNPRINTWFVLEYPDRQGASRFHLENADPQTNTLSLAEDGPAQLVVTRDGRQIRCDVSPAVLDQARRGGAPYASLCNDTVFLRNPTRGRQTSLEKVTDFLRDHAWGGEEVIGLVKTTVMKDAFLEEGEAGVKSAAASGRETDGPRSALLAAKSQEQTVRAGTLAIEAVGTKTGFQLGQWYPMRHLEGAWLSLARPGAVAQEVLDAGADRARPLDGVESKALVYLAAFDLARFDLGFALGTEHPRLEWSPRPPAASRDRRLPGPDGFDNAEPLVRTGLISPRHTSRVVATFTAGFKRRHGAFRYGELAQRNGGSHYGFIESGVVFSRLQPGLATLLVLDDGSVRMQTWRAEDEALLSRVMHARQNGVPIVVPGPADGLPLPGEEVAKWGPGNWSGSAEGKLRSLRGGACLQKNGQRRYLIYGYFSSATPSAMARVFQAYGCSYAMKLDMNALEHTYMAVYHRSADRLEVEHLVDGMSVLDKQADGRVLPRFLGLPDNRDFFYLLAREAPQNGLRTADR